MISNSWPRKLQYNVKKQSSIDIISITLIVIKIVHFTTQTRQQHELHHSGDKLSLNDRKILYYIQFITENEDFWEASTDVWNFAEHFWDTENISQIIVYFSGDYVLILPKILHWIQELCRRFLEDSAKITPKSYYNFSRTCSDDSHRNSCRFFFF